MSSKLKLYEVTNRDTGEKQYAVSDNAQDACKQAGWLVGICYVNEQKPRRMPGRVKDHRLLVKIPCLTCPYQYGECKKPAKEICPARTEAPELQEWLKQTTEAHICPYQGEELTKIDHQLGQKWVTIEEAIKELALKS